MRSPQQFQPKILSLIFLFAIANANAACRDALVAIAQPAPHLAADFPTQIKHYFRYQEKGPYVARGLIVELDDGRQFFSLGEYMGVLHEIMIKDLEAKIGESVITKTGWVGEIEFIKDGDGNFIFAHANQTSGMWFDAVSGKKAIPLKTPILEHGNSGMVLKSFIEKNKLPCVEGFEVESFTADKKHLLLDLKVPENESMLHYLNNVLNISLNISLIVELGAPIEKAEILIASKNVENVILPVILHLENMYAERAPDAFKRDLNFAEWFFRDLLAARKLIESGHDLPADLEARLLNMNSAARISSFLSKVEKAAYNIELATTLPHADDSEELTRIIPQIFHFMQAAESPIP